MKKLTEEGREAGSGRCAAGRCCAAYSCAKKVYERYHLRYCPYLRKADIASIPQTRQQFQLTATSVRWRRRKTGHFRTFLADPDRVFMAAHSSGKIGRAQQRC